MGLYDDTDELGEPTVAEQAGPELIAAFADETTHETALWVIDDPAQPGYLTLEMDVASTDYSDGIMDLSTDEVRDLVDALNLYLSGATA